MKKILLSIFTALLSLTILAQETEKPLVYDYDATRHEIAMDIVPLLGGNLPASFFYRKNYLSSSGQQIGFRLNLAAGNNLNNVDRIIGYTNFTKEAVLNYMISVGTEWQKPVMKNFIGYSGLDLGIGFDSHRLYEVDGIRPGPG